MHAKDVGTATRKSQNALRVVVKMEDTLIRGEAGAGEIPFASTTKI
jgi:hypothetical protein